MTDTLHVNADQIWVDDSFIGYRTRPMCELPKNWKSIPLLVQRSSNGDCPYRLIAGHRLYARRVSSGMLEIPISITEEFNDYSLRIEHLAYAVDNESLTHVEIGNGIHETFTRKETVEQIGQKLNRQKWKIAVWQRLHGLPDRSKELVEANDPDLKEEDLKIIALIDKSSLPYYFRLTTNKPVTKKSQGPRRPTREIVTMMDKATKACGGNNTISRALLWAMYGIPDDQLDNDIRNEQRRLGTQGN